MTISLQQLLKERLVKIRRRGHETITLRQPTLKDLTFLAGLLDESLDAREMAVRMLHNQVQEPSVDIETIRSWPDRLLVRCAAAWAKANLGSYSKSSPQVKTLDDFANALRKYIDEHNKFWRDQMNAVQERVRQMTRPIPIMPSLPDFTAFLPKVDIYVPDTMSKTMEWASMPIADLGKRLLGDIVVKPPALPAAFERSILQGYDDTVRQMLALGGGTPTRAFDAIISENAERMLRSLGSTQAFGEQLAALNSSIERHIENLLRPIDFGQLAKPFFDNLPDFGKFAKDIEDLEKGEQLLIDRGYGYTIHLWKPAFVIGFARVSEKAQAANVTAQLRKWTSGDAFKSKLEAVILNSPLLKRRWKVISSALDAHRRRDFTASVPLLLSQIEGIYADVLIMKRLVAPKHGKLYYRNDDGTIKLNNKGDEQEIVSLPNLIARSKFQNHPVLNALVDLALDGLNKKRNPIMHGRHTAYGDVRTSTRLVLVLYVLASEVAAIEQGKIK